MEIKTGYRYFVGDNAAEVVEIQEIKNRMVLVNCLASDTLMKFRKKQIRYYLEEGEWVDPLRQNGRRV